MHTAFASGLTTPFALAFDSGGNLFVADGGDPWDYPPVPGGVYAFTPTGLLSTIFSDMSGGLAIDSADNLFVGLPGSILKISPTGVRTTFASRSVGAMAFQRNLAPNPTPNPAPTDFNNDGPPDYLLFNTATRATWIWYMNNTGRIGNAAGPTIWGGWSLASVADLIATIIRITCSSTQRPATCDLVHEQQRSRRRGRWPNSSQRLGTRGDRRL